MIRTRKIRRTPPTRTRPTAIPIPANGTRDKAMQNKAAGRFPIHGLLAALARTALKRPRALTLAATLALAAAFTCNASHAAAVQDAKICEQYLQAVSDQSGVPLGVLYAVGMTESGNKGSLHPYALNIAGKSVITYSQ